MNIMHYLSLSYEHQWDAFHDKSVFMARVETIDAVYELYGLDTFYVEIISDPATEQRQATTPFVTGERLEKYLEILGQKGYGVVK